MGRAGGGEGWRCWDTIWETQSVNGRERGRRKRKKFTRTAGTGDGEWPWPELVFESR